MGEEVWYSHQFGLAYPARISERVCLFISAFFFLAARFEPLCLIFTSHSRNVMSPRGFRFLSSLVRYNHSGRLGIINFLNGVMGIANAQRGLEYIRVITEFISYVIF